eukprot:scaffold106174_cov66-Phaeocystis_antarctica.AAC.2
MCPLSSRTWRSRVEEEVGRERLVALARQVGFECHATTEAELLQRTHTRHVHVHVHVQQCI